MLCKVKTGENRETSWVYPAGNNHRKLLIVDSSRQTNTRIIYPLLSTSTLCCVEFVLPCRCSQRFFTAHLPAGDHPAHVDVVVCKDLFGFLDGGFWQGACSPQDPGEVDVEEPEDVSAWIHQGRIHVVSRQDPIRGVGKDCDQDKSCKSEETKVSQYFILKLHILRESRISNMWLIEAD